MEKQLLCPAEFSAAAEQLAMSPGLVSGNHVFLTGTTGSNSVGEMPLDPEEQFRSVFQKIALVLSEAGLTLDSVIEMTSYHVELSAHFDLFDSIRVELFQAPYPAWTAVEVARLRREGALVEIRTVAQIA
ncbi:MAG: RidA family protein [Pseudomonadota bacterium]